MRISQRVKIIVAGGQYIITKHLLYWVCFIRKHQPALNYLDHFTSRPTHVLTRLQHKTKIIIQKFVSTCFCVTTSIYFWIIIQHFILFFIFLCFIFLSDFFNYERGGATTIRYLFTNSHITVYRQYHTNIIIQQYLHIIE